MHDLAKDRRLHGFRLVRHFAKVFEYTVIAGLGFIKVGRIPI